MEKTVVVDVAGRVTIGHDAELRESIQEAMDQGAQNILLNMKRVTKLDSSGVGELVAAHATMSRLDGRLLLVGLSDKIASVLQITNLMGVLESFEDVDSALETLESG
ncbi:MAG: STAS domain-containing protein [Acidobacteriota bacterium]|nr:STAS domain-containing protein [Acidobacteriota bacterium]